MVSLSRLSLDPASPLPLYRQLADLLAAQIEAGSYPVGSPIPSEHELSARHQLGRPTVRQATELLVRRRLVGRRLVGRRRGAGTFVAEQPASVDLFSLGGTLASFESGGVAVTTNIVAPLEERRLPPEAEHPRAGRAAHCFGRLSRLGRSPVLFEELWLDAEVFAGLPTLPLESASLSRLVEERFGLRPLRARQSFRAEPAQGRAARWLALRRGAPLLHVTRALEFPRVGQAFSSELYCRTDRLRFSQTLESTHDA